MDGQNESGFQSQKRLDMLKQRTKRCICKYCGSKLKLRRIIFSEFEDARVEIFCSECNRIEFGVEPAIYGSAKFFVENSAFTCYPDMDDNALTKQMNIAKVAEIISWGNQNLGFLNNDGFTVPLNIDESFIGECITLSEDDLDDEITTEFAL